MFPKDIFISQQEGARLLSSGEWVSDIEVYMDVCKQARALQESWGVWAEQGTGILMQSLKGSSGVGAPFDEMRHAIDAAYSVRMETKILETPPPDYTLGMRVSAHAVYKVRPTAEKLLRDSLRFIMAVTQSSPYTILMAGWVGVELRSLYQTLLEGFERIEDPHEREVLEAIHRLCAKATVVNFDALKEQEFDKAYGFIAPEIDQLVAELEGKVDEREISTALGAMKERKILQQRKGRWMIAF